MGKGFWLTILVVLFLLLTAVDLGLNVVFGWIPYAGAALESISELFIELAQIVIFAVALILGVNRE